MQTKKPALFTISEYNLEKLKVLAQLLGKSKSQFIDDLISEKFNELDKKKMLAKIDETISELEKISQS